MKEKKYILKKIFISYIYIFIIFSTMLPNKSNSINLHELNTIIPGINKLYSNNYNKEKNNSSTYSFKIIEIVQNIL